MAVCLGGWALTRPSSTERLIATIADLNAQMPRRVDDATTETHLGLGNHVLFDHFTVTRLFDDSPAAMAGLHEAMLRHTCANPAARVLLGKGWAIENIYSVTTQHGPDQIGLRVNPSDCG